MDINDKLKEYISNNLEETFVSFRKSRYKVDNACCASFAEIEDIDNKEFTLNENSKMMDACTTNISDFIDDNKTDNKFQKLLFKYIDERNLKDSDVYNKVHIDRRLFSKIRSDSNYHPSKDTVILLALALELNENELLDLLDSASYSLPKNNYFDLIIRFCFIEGVYKINDVNSLLDSYGCKLFYY